MEEIFRRIRECIERRCSNHSLWFLKGARCGIRGRPKLNQSQKNFDGALADLINSVIVLQETR